MTASFRLGVCNCGCEGSIPNIRTRNGYLMLYMQGHNNGYNAHSKKVRRMEKDKKRY